MWMLDELYRFMRLTRELKLLHLPHSNEVKPMGAIVEQKAYLMQVRLDLESRIEE